MANWLAACFHVTGGIFESFSMLRKAGCSSLPAASSLGKWPRFLLAQRQAHAFDGVGRIDDLADFGRIGEERNHLLPLALPLAVTVGNFRPQSPAAKAAGADAAASAVAA